MSNGAGWKAATFLHKTPNIGDGKSHNSGIGEDIGNLEIVENWRWRSDAPEQAICTPLVMIRRARIKDAIFGNLGHI